MHTDYTHTITLTRTHTAHTLPLSLPPLQEYGLAVNMALHLGEQGTLKAAVDAVPEQVRTLDLTYTKRYPE